MKYATFSLEYSLLNQGNSCVAGIDEVGRGCLAGPVVASAVVISSPDQFLENIRDSKLMTEKQREDVYDELTGLVDCYGIGEVVPIDIDRIGIGPAVSLAMLRAYENLKKHPDIVLVDGGNVQSPNMKKMHIAQGDQKHYVIAVASVIAKVYRDRLMKKMAVDYPEFGFENHVGYGTKAHMNALAQYGVTKIHRASFSPVKKALRDGRMYGSI